MDGFLSFLLFAALFYVMIRWGSGAHMTHGHGGGHGSRSAKDDTHFDPVCHETVPIYVGYGKMVQGQLYRFCSRACLDAFEAEPERYLGEQPKALSS